MLNLRQLSRPLWALVLAGSLISCSSGAEVGPKVSAVNGPMVQAWVTTADKSRLLSREADRAFSSQSALALNIDVDASRRYQSMVGFGASLTDASAWLIQNRMSATQRLALLQELFGRGASGIGMDVARLTIGASDFSRSHYSFDDMPAGQADPNLDHFSIDASRADVLPVIKSALSINPKLQVMAAPWSAPGWMKTNGSLIQGALKPEMYGAYAAYLGRYLDAYAAEGVPIFALSVQNEPHFEPGDYPGMRVDSAARAALIGQHLGPLLAQRAQPTQIIEWDHNWDAPEAPLSVLSDATARRYIAGVGWHCYAGQVQAQTTVHSAYPDKDTWFTECSSGEWMPTWQVALPWLANNLVIDATRGWARGVLLWNLALDENHGPHLGGCSNCRGVVTIDSNTGEVTRNAEYYVLAHAAKFVRPGAQRIESTEVADTLKSVAFRNIDDGSVVLIVCNAASSERRFSGRANGQVFEATLPRESLATFVWMPAS